MNEQQEIGYRNILAEADRIAGAVDALELEIRAKGKLLSSLKPFGHGAHALRAVADWATTIDSFRDALPRELRDDAQALRDDAQALARWIEGRL